MLALASSKGGAGRTTLCAALAVRAVQHGKWVALIDRDPQESLAAWADRGGRRSNPHLIDIDSTADAIRLALAEGSHAYDYAIIDTPRWHVYLIDEVIAQASFVLIPCRASVGKGPTEIERDKQAAAELDALWAELEILMKMRFKR